MSTISQRSSVSSNTSATAAAVSLRMRSVSMRGSRKRRRRSEFAGTAARGSGLSVVWSILLSARSGESLTLRRIGRLAWRGRQGRAEGTVTVCRSADEWRPIAGYEGYAINRAGDVLSLERVIEKRDGTRQPFKARILAPC